MDLTDEVAQIFAAYRATGRTPEMPDRELPPGGPAMGPAQWFGLLSSGDQQRMRRAIEISSSSGYCGVWHD